MAVALPRLVILGAGGHARVVLECARRQGRYAVEGLIDPERPGRLVDGAPVLGGDDHLEELRRLGVSVAVVGIAGLGAGAVRQRLFDQLVALGFDGALIVHPSATVSEYAQLGQGVVIMPGAVVNAGAVLGDNVIVNSGAIVEHDTEVAAHVHVAPGAVVCGGVRIGTGAYIGAGAAIRQGVTIGDGAVVGAGAAVVGDVAAGAVVTGVPAGARQV